MNALIGAGEWRGKAAYVYPVQNTTASLAVLLNSIYSGSGQGGGQSALDNPVAPGLNRESVGVRWAAPVWVAGGARGLSEWR